MRIIAGTARGRKLRTLEGSDVRPTTDKVKEAMFSAVQFQYLISNLASTVAVASITPLSFVPSGNNADISIPIVAFVTIL